MSTQDPSIQKNTFMVQVFTFDNFGSSILKSDEFTTIIQNEMILLDNAFIDTDT